jgi:hypothetical protein
MNNQARAVPARATVVDLPPALPGGNQSGDAIRCSNGSGATGTGCDDAGNDAQALCGAYGNGAAGDCMTGESPVAFCDTGSGDVR